MKHFLIIAVAIALLAAACDDDSDGTSAAIDDRFVVDSTPGEPVTPSIVDEPGGTPVTVDEPGARELLALFDAGLSATYRVTYHTSSGEGETGDSYNVFNMPPLSRVDTVSAGSDTPLSIVIQKAAGSAVNCVPEDGDWACDEVDALGGSAVIWAGGVIYPGLADLESATVTDVGGREVAGHQAQCFNIADDANSTALTYCMNAEGVVLYSSGDFGVVEAESYSTAVSEDDFLLP